MSPLGFSVLFLIAIAQFSLACPGCSKDVNGNEAYEYVSEKLNNLKASPPKGMENEEKAELVRIYKAEKRVVSGNQYTYEFEARGLTTKQLYDCSLVVISQAWKGRESIVDFTCHPGNSASRPLLGGEFPLDVTKDNRLKQLKPVIGQEVGKTLNSEHIMKVTQYLGATEQIVAGSFIKATVEVASTNCPLKEAANDGDCQIQNEKRQLCEVHVWLKPWLKMQQVSVVKCETQPKFCAGCPYESSPNDKFVQQSLKRTLSNLNAQGHSTQRLSLIKINKVVSQVIAGVKYTVEFDANDVSSQAAYSCSAVIISQPWITEEPILSDFQCTPSTH